MISNEEKLQKRCVLFFLLTKAQNGHVIITTRQPLVRFILRSKHKLL